MGVMRDFFSEDLSGPLGLDEREAAVERVERLETVDPFEVGE